MNPTRFGILSIGASLLAAVLWNGCNCSANPGGSTDGSEPPDAGSSDGSAPGPDAAAVDSGTTSDSGNPGDAGGAADAGSSDASTSDAGTLDGGVADASGLDAGACTTACDCTPGLACFNGACVQGFAPVYCCSSTICPAGSICQDTTGQYNRCPASNDAGFVDAGSCQTACDCPTGMPCFNGQCQITNIQVFCCGAPICPAGSPCQDGTTGAYSRCVGDGGVADAGGFCQFINCNNNSMCTRAGCTACGGNGTCLP